MINSPMQIAEHVGPPHPNSAVLFEDQPSNHAQLGKSYADQGRWSEAGREFGLAAALVEEIDLNHLTKLKRAACYRYAEGLSWFHVPRCRPLAKLALDTAFKYFNKVEDLDSAAQLWLVLEEMRRAQTDVESDFCPTHSLKLINQILSGGQIEDTIYFIRTRAFLYSLVKDWSAAEDDLLLAYRQANEARLVEDIPQIERELSLLKTKSYPSPNLTFDLLQAIQLHYKSQKFRNAGRNLYLEQALRYYKERAFDEVVIRASAAQLEALTFSVPQRFFDYLSASLLLAMGYEALHEDVLVLDTLFVCKRRLEGEIGTPSGELIKQITGRLVNRWESDRFYKAMGNRTEE